MNAWSHLPNAPHIDRILSDLKANINDWAAARRAAWGCVRSAARRAAMQAAVLDVTRDAAWDAAWDAAFDTARNETTVTARGTARGAAWDAIAALVAWDHAGSYFSLTPDQVKTLVYLGDNIAILMLPAVIALESPTIKPKEKENAMQ